MTMKKNLPNISFTTKNNLCTGCGICQGACPSTAISMHVSKNGTFLPSIDKSKCKNAQGCHRCYDSCPGVGINLIGLARQEFNDENIHEDKMVGRYLKCFSGYSNDNEVRKHSASGGMVSQFLIWLIENKIIDGAVVTKFDNKNPLMVSSYIAKTKEEIIAARSSKYAPVTLNHIVQDIKNSFGSKYVIVGVPCHIQGIRKIATIDKQLRTKIVGFFSLYCSCGRTFNLTEFILKERKIQRNNLKNFQYRDDGCLGFLKATLSSQDTTLKPFNQYATLTIEGNDQIYKEHFQSYYHPLRSFFVPKRCLFCIDHYGELADISFGDIHIKPYSDDRIGTNSIIVRKKEWLNLLQQCKAEGLVTLSEITFKTISDSQPMSYKKKGRNGAFIRIAQTMGRKVPKYDVNYLRRPTFRDFIDYVQNRIQQFLGSHKKLWFIIPFLKAKIKIY